MASYVSDDQNLDKILDKYKNLNDDQDLGNTEQYLIDSFNTDSNICLICIESIGIRQQIWNCEGCFAQFHIACIQNWIRDGSYLAISANFEENNPKNIPWNCPKCRKTYQQENYPSVYYCYCRKVKDPVFDPWSLPHSCNQTCGRAKPCGHSCLTLCHPGPCPPCPKMVTVSCSCSKSQPVARRCSNKHWSCNKTCNRLLPCKQHLCERICHEGSCGECNKTSIQFCKCKKSRKQVPCTETVWDCGQKCLKDYLCGFHKCELVCHSGPCGDCPKSLIRTCPCGKSKSTKPCNEDIPTCGDTCGKLLSCGIHSCAMRCHYGPCETCRQLVLKKCRCGQKEKTLACFTEFTCEQKCNRMRNCGKHKCNKKCCEGNCPPCEQICNKPLSCKNHKCKSLCHSGPCYPCPLMEEISCPCGSSKLKVPCVKSNSNIKVSCKQPCNRDSRCHHGKIQRHRCHYNDCPPCELKCELKLNCAHLCQATCHDSVLTEIVENKDRDGPWLPLNRKKVHVKLPCPECNHPIPTKCLGNHEISDVPCYRQGPFSCGRKCGRPLKCSHHTCQLDCHFIPEDELNKTNQASSRCEECTRDCEQARPKGCEHECSIGVCHAGECPKCVQLTKMKCHCQSNFVYVECNKWNASSKKQDREDLQSCKVPCTKNISCGHSCTLKCHSGKCSSESECTAKVTLRCQCKKLKKTFVCNQIKSQFERQQKSGENDDLIKVNDRICLKCNQKCSDGKQTAVNDDENESKSKPTETEAKNRPQSNLIYYLLALIFLFISAFIFYMLSNKSSN